MRAATSARRLPTAWWWMIGLAPPPVKVFDHVSVNS
jgi:hypothetical protein